MVAERTDRSTATSTGRGDYVPKPEYATFAAALRRHRQGSGFPTQARLAAMLDVSWHAVGSWEKAIWAPAPAKVFEIERVLALPPGSLSHHLGYLPVAGAQPSVSSAIDADPKLDERAKGLLTEMYRSLAREEAVGSAESPGRRRRQAKTGEQAALDF